MNLIAHFTPILNCDHTLSQEAQGPLESMVQYHLRRKEKVDLMEQTYCAIDEITHLKGLADLVNGTHTKQWMM